MAVAVGVIGVGRWGPNLLRNFHNHRTSEVVVIAEQDDARRSQIAELYRDVRTVDNADEVIDADGVDAIAIATPTATHYDLVKRALLAGKHVMVEKPLTHDLDTATELAALVSDRELVLVVGHVFLFNPAVQRVKQYLDDGELGNPYYISMVRTNLGPIRTDVNVSWDLAAHDVSIANYWLDSVPISAAATGGSWINPGIADAVFAVLRYPNDVMVNLQVSWLNPRKARDITVVGDHKMLTLDDMNVQEPLRIYDKGVVDAAVQEGVIDTLSGHRSIVHEGAIWIPPVSLGEPLRAECDHFVDCIANGTRPRAGAGVAVDVVRVLDAIDRSMHNDGAAEKVRGS